MIKKSFRLMLLVAFALSSVMFVACNKYDEDIERLDQEIASLQATVQTLKSAVEGGAVISSVTNTADGVKFTLSNGQSYTVANGVAGKDGQDGKDGKDGKDGSVVTIGENGNWFIDGEDQGINATQPYVVDSGAWYTLYVMEQVDGANAEIIEVKLPKTATITDIKAVKIATTGAVTAADVTLNYGMGPNSKLEFNGKNYKNLPLIGIGSSLSALINPIEAEANLYNFSLVDSKGNTRFVLGTATPNKTENTLSTRAGETVNKGAWDMTIEFADNATLSSTEKTGMYALTTLTANGTIASAYDVKVIEKYVAANALNNPVALSDVDDNKTRSIDLTTSFNKMDYVVDYYFEYVDEIAAETVGANLSGDILTATNAGKVSIYVNYLLIDQTIKKETIEAEFLNIPTPGALNNIAWEIQLDNASTSKIIETDYYLPIAAIKSSLKGTSNVMPAVAKGTVTWADGDELNEKFFAVNGAYYGTKPSGSTVTATPTAISEAWIIKDVDQSNWYTWDATNSKYVTTTDFNDDLYVKVSFDPANAMVGEFTLPLYFKKAGETAANDPVIISVAVNVSITAPAITIVKNEPYFSGDNAILYGDPVGSLVEADLNDLFTTEHMVYTVTKIKQTSSSSQTDWYPWVGADGGSNSTNQTTGNITVPVKSTAQANYCVGTTQEFVASRALFAGEASVNSGAGNTHVEVATYTFTVTAKSPVKVEYTGSAKTIANDPVYIAVDEFTSMTVKTGDALYLGTIYDANGTAVHNQTDTPDITTVSVKADEDDDNSKYITVETAFNATSKVTRYASDNSVASYADAVKVSRVAGYALQQPVTCKVNVSVTDAWGVTNVVTVNVTVNPL